MTKQKGRLIRKVFKLNGRIKGTILSGSNSNSKFVFQSQKLTSKSLQIQDPKNFAEDGTINPDGAMTQSLRANRSS